MNIAYLTPSLLDSDLLLVFEMDKQLVVSWQLPDELASIWRDALHG